MTTSTPAQREDVNVVDPRQVKRAITAATIGNLTEWYDFGVYAYLATTIGKVFFPSSSTTTQLLATFGTFAVAFLVRPLGGMFFGPLGDRVGRTKVLAATMIMMAIGTFCIGIIPSYETIGIAAPALLLLARLVQGFSTGGEYGGAMTFIAEYTPDRRRGFFGSFLEFGTLVGFILGAGTVALLTAALSEQDMLSWGWRIPFLVALPMGLIGLYLRLKLGETPAFAKHSEERAQDEKRTKREEFRFIFVENWRAMVACVGLVLTYNVACYMFFSYMPTYMSVELKSDISDTESNLLQVGVMSAMLLVITFIGRLSDRVGRRPVLLAGAGSMVVLAFPALLLIQVGTTASAFAGLLLMGLMVVFFAATMTSALPALFPTEVRQGALSISFNVSVSLFGGTTASVMTALIAVSGDLMWPAYYLVAAGVIGGLAVWRIAESANKPLKGAPPAVEMGEEPASER
ncbi:MFS transporter [Saccharopolyspora karakumensis]|uniref:Putative proline/betaine transporter n=1 Tax=Saccharopolyspora karakumensis TaxID=2530386 RepID=A0A4R5BXU0_9PSEU|nr:MFS transporter [Saccharopolyspora karakumensis]TDD89194.1 MFS transporter [Saccharopolyspora karakumensis]